MALAGDLMGRRIVGGRYRILHLIYSGTMSSVFKAWDHEQKKPVAIKIATNNSVHPDLVEYLKNEASVLRRLDHPGVVRLVDFGDLDGSHFLVLEYVSGLNIARCFGSARPMSLDRATLILTGVLEILQSINQAGFVHRDIKPENVMLAQDGTVKLIDFGLAKPICPVGNGLSIPVAKLAGTLPYLSPEQVRYNDLDCRSDLYSCGVMLYVMLTGRYPFFEYKKNGEMVQYWKLPKRDYPDFPYIPHEVRRVIDQALEVDPDHRFQSALEMALALQLAAEPESIEDLVLGIFEGETTRPLNIVRSC